MESNTLILDSHEPTETPIPGIGLDTTLLVAWQAKRFVK